MQYIKLIIVSIPKHAIDKIINGIIAMANPLTADGSSAKAFLVVK